MSELRVTNIVGEDGVSSPTFTRGINVTGVITATTLNQVVSGIITATTFDGNLQGNVNGNVTGNATSATVANGLGASASVSTSGIITASSFVGALTGNADTATTAQGLTGTPNITVGVATATSAVVGSNVTINSSGVDVTGVVTSTSAVVGSNVTINSSGVNVSGAVTATSFVGDGSGLTSLAGIGSGVVVQNSGSPIGTAGTINFGTALTVTPISAGIVTVNNTGISSVFEDEFPQLGGDLDLGGYDITGTGSISVTNTIRSNTGFNTDGGVNLIFRVSGSSLIFEVVGVGSTTLTLA